MWFCTLLVVFLNTGRIAADTYKVESACRTSNNKFGSCIALKSCESLYQLLLTDGRNSSTASFLRKSQCGSLFENGIPTVCCPDHTNMIETSVTKPSVTNRPQAQEPKTTETTLKYKKCGIFERQETRIVNTGRNATLGNWPWMVALGYRRMPKSNLEFKCGATLISDRWILAAAHCLQNLGNFQLTTARLGDLDLNPNVTDEATPIDEPIDEIISHPEYTTNPITNDIALLRLKNAVNFNKYIRPICLLSETLYRSDSFYSNKRPFFIGWGAVEWQGASSTRLQETTINIVNNTVCANNYAEERTVKIDHRVLCAGEKNKDSCQGDPGGPLIFPLGDGPVFYLGGVISFGFRCTDHSFPGVFTKVAAFVDWISRTTSLRIV